MNTFTTATVATRHAPAPTLRGNLLAIAHALRTELAPAEDATLSVLIDDMPVSIAPTRNGRLAAFFEIADADSVAPEVFVGALSEAAAWGVQGETQRFVVVDGVFVLLWTPVPMPEGELLSQLEEAIAIALAVRELAARFPG